MTFNDKQTQKPLRLRGGGGFSKLVSSLTCTGNSAIEDPQPRRPSATSQSSHASSTSTATRYSSTSNAPRMHQRGPSESGMSRVPQEAGGRFPVYPGTQYTHQRSPPRQDRQYHQKGQVKEDDAATRRPADALAEDVKKKDEEREMTERMMDW